MRLLAKWHIWLAWAFGIPVLMWTVTGLIMVSRPIEEVRGNHLRIEQAEQALVLPDSEIASAETNLKEMRVVMQNGRAVALLTGLDGAASRVDMTTGEAIPAITAADASQIVSERIKGGERIRSVTFFDADEVPVDFRRPKPVWQVALKDGAHIYIGRDTGEIEAVRTRWWRIFDFAWGLHIMDLETREDSSHPILIIFTALGVIGSLAGVILMFRKRKKRRSSPA
ncbi:PepSY domain-containing protein [Qipengyuania sp. DGS5-3]|uniref:PepSY domain-containing protein n=1 Tax=Qipengyuania sp. DGS5-3 TaxID=3349632 RepID=UPI0036D341EF